jgi:diguanylate cyclase (GGDEF)-like protein/PAS domain S-box-containing protein
VKVRGLNLLVGAVCVTGFLSMGLDLVGAGGWGRPSALDLVGALTIGFLADLSLINIRFGRQRYSFTWSEAFVILGVVLVPRPWLVMLVPAGAALMHLSLRRPLVKSAFNAFGLATGAFLASVVYRGAASVGSGSVLSRPTTWTGLVAASLVLFLWSHGTVAGAIALTQGLGVRQVLQKNLALSLLVWAGNTVVGCGFVALYLYDSHSVALLPIMLGFVLLIYRSYMGAVNEAQAWQLLQDLSGRLSQLDHSQLSMAAAEAAASLFEADRAELVLVEDGRAEIWRHRSGEAERVEAPVEVASPALWPRCDQERGVVRLARKGADGPAAAELDALGVSYAVAAWLGPAVPGMLRLGFSAPVRVKDRQLRLLGTFVNQVDTALVNARLYQRMSQLSEQNRAIAESLGEGVIAIDNDGLITFVNPAGTGMVGLGAESLVGHHVHDVLHGPGSEMHPEGGVCPLLRVLERAELVRVENHSVLHARIGQLPVAFTAAPVLSSDGETTAGAVIALRDMTERRALEAQLTYQAFHDAITDVANRALFLDRLQNVMSRRSAGRVAVLFVDLDRFKVVNDSLGHRAGDALLRQVAQRISSCLRPSDTLARWGGDEFTVLLESVESEREAAAVAQRILAAMGRAFPAVGRDVVLSVSVGIALGRPLLNDPQEVIHDADVAMYRAKHRGRDTYAVFEPDMGDQPLERLELETSLRRGLEEGEFHAFYQPVVSLETGRISGVEALVRWNTPDGLLLPAAFIGLAEETGLIIPLGHQVLEEACRQVRRWHDGHPELDPVTLNVNLSARQFQDGGLVRDVSGILESTGLDPGHLCLEITETVIMQDVPATVATLNELKGLGVQLSIDDFGTGYSSLSYLKRFPVDAVKIDRSFIDGLGENPVDTEIVAAVVRLSRSLGMHTVAEGVETEAQLERLQELGCPLVQGFYFSAAQNPERVEAMLGDQLLSRVAAVGGAAD